MKKHTVMAALCLVSLASLVGVAFSHEEPELANPRKVMHRLLHDNDPNLNRLAHSQAGQAGKGKPGNNGIVNHGGPVMLETTNIYYIWYGNWEGNPTTTILTDFANSIGGSPYFNINTTYTSSGGTKISNLVNYAGSTTVGDYKYGSSLTDANILQIVRDAIQDGPFIADPHGVYFVLTSADVTASSGFCTRYCGWHSYSYTNFGSGTVDVKYSFVGDSSRCPGACSAQTVGPNDAQSTAIGADGMASIIAHELEEAVTDPDLNAWYDTRGYENADKCAWTFGSTFTASNGAVANMVLGDRQYLIQQNWVNATGGYCAKSYTTP